MRGMSRAMQLQRDRFITIKVGLCISRRNFVDNKIGRDHGDAELNSHIDAFAHRTQ